MSTGERPLILLIGASGTMGSEVIRALAGRSRLRVLVRSERSELALARRYPMAERIRGDLRDPASLRAAVRGVERLFLLTPSVADQQALEQAALDAAVEAGVERIVYLSSTDVRWDLELSAPHRATERALAAGRVAHTVLRAEYLLDNLLLELDDLLAGRLIAPAGVMRCPFLDARDVGGVAAAALLADTALPGPLEITGPQALSWPDLAERLGQALGRRVEHLDPDPEEWAQGATAAGMDPWLAGALGEYFAAMRHKSLQPSGDVLRVTHRSPRSAESFAREVLAPASRRHIAPARPKPNATASLRIPISHQEAACLKQ